MNARIEELSGTKRYRPWLRYGARNTSCELPSLLSTDSSATAKRAAASPNINPYYIVDDNFTLEGAHQHLRAISCASDNITFGTVGDVHISMLEPEGWSIVDNDCVQFIGEASSTAWGVVCVGNDRHEAEKHLNSLTAAAKDEIFEDGVESAFTKGLRSFLDTYSMVAVSAIGNAKVAGKIPDSIAAEMARFLGDVDHSATRAQRFQLLSRWLSDQSVIVRDGAAIGLGYFGGHVALDRLRVAYDDEQVAIMRDDLRDLIEALAS